MNALRFWYRLSLAYFALLLVFVVLFSLAIQIGWVSDTGAGLLGTLSLAGFLLAGLPLTVRLARRAQQSQPVWVYVLLYVALAFMAGLGAWALLGFLTYLAHKKINLGNSHGL